MKHLYACFIAVFIISFGFAQTGSVSMRKLGGAATAYPSITLAYAAIPTGTTDNYLIEIHPSYNGQHASEVYPIKFGPKALTNATITIRPAAGNNNAELRYNNISNPVLSVVAFDTATNVILDGRPGGVTSDTANYLKIRCYYPSLDPIIGVNITGGSKNNVVRYVSLIAQVAGINAPIGFNLVVTNPGADINRNNTVSHSKSVNGHVGFADFCLSPVAYNEGTQFINNYIENAALTGIVINSRAKNALVENNFVYYSGNTVSDMMYGIATQADIPGTTVIRDNVVSLLIDSASTLSLLGGINMSGSDSAVCSGNEIEIKLGVNQTDTYIQGIASSYIDADVPRYVRVFNNKIASIEKDSSSQTAQLVGMDFDVPDSSNLSVYNNFIALPATNANAVPVGLRVVGTDYFTSNIYFNSIYIGGANNSDVSPIGAIGVIAMADGTAPNGNFKMKNNLIMVNRDNSNFGLMAAGFVNQLVGTDMRLDIDYNSYYVSDTINSIYVFAGGFYTKDQLSLYKTEMDSIEQHSFFKEAKFVSGSDLHLHATSKTDTAFLGTPVAGISVDIDGDPRSSTRPTMGADEGFATLPVELISFTGKKTPAGNLLEWKTAAEINSLGFEIEYAVDGKNFQKIGWQSSKAEAGFSSTALSYTFLDDKAADDISYYRLKQMNADKRTTYSNIVVIRSQSMANELIVYPNPANHFIYIKTQAVKAGTAFLSLMDVNGKTLLQKQFPFAVGQNEIQFDVSAIPTGVYYLRVEGVDGKTMQQKLIKE